MKRFVLAGLVLAVLPLAGMFLMPGTSTPCTPAAWARGGPGVSRGSPTTFFAYCNTLLIPEVSCTAAGGPDVPCDSP